MSFITTQTAGIINDVSVHSALLHGLFPNQCKHDTSRRSSIACAELLNLSSGSTVQSERRRHTRCGSGLQHGPAPAR